MDRQQHVGTATVLPTFIGQASQCVTLRQRLLVYPSMERICPMGLFSRDIKTMDDLFLHTLQDVYYARIRS